VLDLTSVTVSWNSGRTLGPCLSALLEAAADAGISLRAVVVDNASTDDSVTVARAHGADVIRSACNVGFAAAVNRGVARATSEWVFLANPDLQVSSSFFRVLLQYEAQVASRVAVLVPDVRFIAAPESINTRGLSIDSTGIPSELQHGDCADSAGPPAHVFGGSGGALLLRRAALAAIGGFEPMFFAYLEDADLSWRLRKAGFGAEFVPGAIALHEGSSTTSVDSPLRAHLVARNRRLLFRLHAPHGVNARIWRLVIEVAHGVVQTALSRSAAPISGRAEALRFRSRVAFLRAVDRRGRLTAAVPLAGRVGLRAMLGRKLVGRRLMHRSATDLVMKLAEELPHDAP
jgi:N-acetylglucosaminyl-diphospho-decaprenol L-rhamnosyltransferase